MRARTSRIKYKLFPWELGLVVLTGSFLASALMNNCPCLEVEYISQLSPQPHWCKAYFPFPYSPSLLHIFPKLLRGRYWHFQYLLLLCSSCFSLIVSSSIIIYLPFTTMPCFINDLGVVVPLHDGLRSVPSTTESSEALLQRNSLLTALFPVDRWSFYWHDSAFSPS